MNDTTLALIWLNSFGMSAAKCHALLELVDEPAQLKSDLEKLKSVIINKFNQETYDKLYFACGQEYLDMLLEEISRYRLEIIHIYDDRYSNYLKEIDIPPILLYCRGNTDLLNTRSIAVVGTRKPTRYGKDVTTELVGGLCKYGFTIVSGLARGIDGIAHRIALLNNAPTIAVLGNGLDSVYPPEHREIATSIVNNGGLVISEYRVGEKPLPFHFPERNRIITGLSRGVLVTEAGENSGTLITMNCAIEMGRDLYVVPGSIYSKTSIGTNSMIKNYNTSLTTSIDDILVGYGIDKIENEDITVEQLSIVESTIITELEKENMHIEEIIDFTNLSINEINSTLMRLEILGLVKKLHGNKYGV